MHTTPTVATPAAAARAGATNGYFAGRTIAKLGADLRSGRSTATELAHLALAAVDDSNGAVNAFAWVDADGALAAARAADRELADGRDRGPLHGLPVGIKDMIDVAGLPTTAGSAHLVGRRVARTDATCVSRLRLAGAVIVGKTVTHEFAYGPTGDRSVQGPTRNPVDLARMSGGSSGGSAAAVGAGMVAYALGTDTGGSVRIPAALCGVAGFKPAYASIPTAGVLPLARSLDHVGVLAATAADCLTVHRALADSRGRSEAAGSVDAAPPRVAWLHTGELVGGDPRVTRAVRAALESAGIPVQDVNWDWMESCREAFRTVQGTEAVALHAARMKFAPRLFDAEVLERLNAAAQFPADAYGDALRTKAAAGRAAAALLDDFDVLALPTVPVVAPPLGARDLVRDGGPAAGVRDTLLALTSTWNLLGLPALSVPAGTVDGLPVAVQLVCREGHEAVAAAVAQRIVT